MTVRVTSSIRVDAPPEAVWAVLCDARMPATAPCEFRFGALGPPRPLRCELPDSRGGVGARRRCRTDQGGVEPRVVEWSVGERLACEGGAHDAWLSRHLLRLPRRLLPQ